MSPLLKFLGRRLLLAAITFLVITAILYGIMMLAPPEMRAMIYLPRGGQGRSANFLRTIIDQKGLDDPYPVQYTRWLVNLLRGDWGWSPTMHDDVLAGFLRRTPVTAELTVALVGTLVGAISGYAGGTLNAVKRCVSRFSGHSQRVPLSHNYGDGRRLGLWQFSPGCRNLASNTV